ncbi:zinc finger, CCHC-type containing protein [Tanacetum coccineum]
MAGNTVKDNTTNFEKLDKFKGHDFRRWHKKMYFLLTTLKVAYVLTTPMPKLVEYATVEAIRIRAKWENNDYIFEGAHTEWPVMEQFNELLRILGQYTQHGLKMDESIFVSSIIDKLPPSWKDFKHTLKYGKDDLSWGQLGSHLRIKESLRAQESDKGKGKEVTGPSVNMTKEETKVGMLEVWQDFKKDCRSGKKNNANAGGSGKGSKDQSQDQGQNLVPVWNRFIKYSVSLISEAFYVQVDAIAWWIDSGATTHVCKDRCWFKTYEMVENRSVLYMGDDHFALVHGKGSVASKFSFGKTITLFNVLYVPKLRKNLVSSPVLNKCGYKQVYEYDKYILSKSGVFLGFRYYNNGIFMLNLNKVPNDSDYVYMSSSIVVNYSLWHARLGHVHYKRMLEMSKDDLIPAIDENLEKCTTCGEYNDHVFFQSVGIIHETITPYTPQQNGVARRKNIALKEMVNSMLSYSVWGCTAVVRLPDPKRKTLGEKGIYCIFVGYAEHSKAYRFYVIEPNDSISINSIIESRDVIFDENRFSSIPRPKDVIPNSVESQRDDHSDDVPSEIPEPHKGKRVRKAKSHGFDFQLYLVEGSKIIDDEIGSIMENNTWVLSDLPYGCKPLGCKWIFKRKTKVDGMIDKFKVRLVIQDFRQKERIDISIPMDQLLVSLLLDCNEHKVCKLVKSLYGLKQAPKQWHQKFDKVMLSSGFHLNQSDKCVYSKFDNSGKGVIICLYVDDMLIFGTAQNQVDKTKKFLSSRFSMKDMGEADVILGIKIKRENKGIVITQSHYIEKILKKFNREDCSPVSTPMDPVEKLKPNTGKPVDQLEYSRAIGCLMYAMTSTRPDIAYVVGRLSRFTSNPSRQHWKAITRVFKYLRGTMNYGLSYVGYPSVLEAYSDASWINHVEDSSSTSGWVFLLRGGAISWASKKQTCITGSTIESEFVALAAAGKEAEWLRNLIHEIPIWPKPIAPISIRCDSAPTMARAYSEIYNGKSRC